MTVLISILSYLHIKSLFNLQRQFLLAFSVCCHLANWFVEHKHTHTHRRLCIYKNEKIINLNRFSVACVYACETCNLKNRLYYESIQFKIQLDFVFIHTYMFQWSNTLYTYRYLIMNTIFKLNVVILYFTIRHS